jgi:hypothetical protein
MLLFPIEFEVEFDVEEVVIPSVAGVIRGEGVFLDVGALGLYHDFVEYPFFYGFGGGLYDGFAALASHQQQDWEERDYPRQTELSHDRDMIFNMLKQSIRVWHEQFLILTNCRSMYMRVRDVGTEWHLDRTIFVESHVQRLWYRDMSN